MRFGSTCLKFHVRGSGPSPAPREHVFPTRNFGNLGDQPEDQSKVLAFRPTFSQPTVRTPPFRNCYGRRLVQPKCLNRSLDLAEEARFQLHSVVEAPPVHHSTSF